MSGKRKSPWYRQTYWLDQAASYMQAGLSLPADAPQRAQVKAFGHFSLARLIFESNLMEGAGLSEGETRSIVDEAIPALPAHVSGFQDHPASLIRKKLEPDLDAVQALLTARPYLFPLFEKPRLRFAGKERGLSEVVNHMVAYSSISQTAHEHWAPLQLWVLARDPAWRSRLIEHGWQPTEEPPAPLSEELLRSVHAQLAEDLEEPDHLVSPGHYRIDNRMAGINTVFVAHELIPEAMQRFVADANQLLIEPGAPWHKAAWISHRFVEIHPFPDFNGRLSRLLLALVLHAFNVPFAVTLRGRKKDKAHYLAALRKADRGNLQPYEILIARAIVEDFQEIDRQLGAAGIRPILSRDTAEDTSE